MKRDRKYYEIECSKCKCIQTMPRVGYSEALDVVWFKCPGCHRNYAFPSGKLNADGTIALPESQAKASLLRRLNSEVVEYVPSTRYQVGQRIHHTALNDNGQVILEKTMNGYDKIVVAFERIGKKTLVHGRGAGD